MAGVGHELEQTRHLEGGVADVADLAGVQEGGIDSCLRGVRTVAHENPLKLALGICKNFGPGAMLGFVKFMKFCQYPAHVLDRFTARKAPRSLSELIAEAPTEEKREQLKLAFYGSAMDIINKFFPDKVKH